MLSLMYLIYYYKLTDSCILLTLSIFAHYILYFDKNSFTFFFA